MAAAAGCKGALTNPIKERTASSPIHNVKTVGDRSPTAAVAATKNAEPKQNTINVARRTTRSISQPAGTIASV